MKRHTPRTAQKHLKAQFAAVASLLVAATFVFTSAEKANAQYQNSGYISAQQLIGGWGYAKRFEDGSELRISFTLASDGRYAGWIKVTAADGRSQEHTNYGYWTVQGSDLIVNSEQGPVRHAIQLNGNQLRVYLPAFQTTLTFVPAGVYVIGPDGKRRVVDRV